MTKPTFVECASCAAKGGTPELCLIPITEVPGQMCCQRNGCRQIFDAFLNPPVRN
jgi:hypothetical protein